MSARDELAAAVAEHGPFPMPAGTPPTPGELAEQRHLVDPLDHALEHLADEAPAPRDLRPGAEAARRMIRTRQDAS